MSARRGRQDTSVRQVGRLAFREEGELWNAYYALTDTMAGALYLGGIHMRFARVKAHKKVFMRLMRECVSDIMRETLGHRPAWKDPVPAPEHERGGKA